MAAWIVPALKAVLPHLGTIVSVAAPVFTKKKADAADATALMQQQIAELQAASSQNAIHIHELAEQMKETVVALEQAAGAAGARLRRVYFFCLGAAVVSVITLGAALYLIMSR